MLNRRLLMAQAGAQPPGGGIVTDGLQMRLSGIDKGPDAAYWSDLIQPGRRFKLTGCNVLPDAVQFTGRKDSFAELVSGSDDFPATGTIDFIIRAAKWNINNTAIFTAKSDDLQALIRNSGNTISLRPRHSRTGAYLNGRVGTFSAYAVDNTDIVTMNMKRLGSNPYNQAVITDEKVYLGRGTWRGQPDSLFMGEICEIRYYSRHLTEAEILQNQQYDIDTYFGGVVPE